MNHSVFDEIWGDLSDIWMKERTSSMWNNLLCAPRLQCKIIIRKIQNKLNPFASSYLFREQNEWSLQIWHTHKWIDVTHAHTHNVVNVVQVTLSSVVVESVHCNGANALRVQGCLSPPNERYWVFTGIIIPPVFLPFNLMGRRTDEWVTRHSIILCFSRC